MFSSKFKAVSMSIPTYAVTPDMTSVNESGSVFFTINTTNVPNGTVLYWTLAGTATAPDFYNGESYGSVTINNNSAQVICSTIVDSSDLGPETFSLQLRTGSTSGFIVANSSIVTINSYDPYWANVAVQSNGGDIGSFTAYGNTAPGVTNPTTNPKFGTKSNYFNGSASTYVQYNNGSMLNLSTGDFTVEGWFYPTNLAANNRLVTIGGSTTGYATIMIYLSPNGSTAFNLSSNNSSWLINPAIDGVNRSVAGLITTGTWYHIALVRSGSVFTYYINGVAVASYSNSVTLFSGTIHRLGLSSDTTPNSPFYGYMDEVRITKGIARYTANFPVPTEPFPTNRS